MSIVEEIKNNPDIDLTGKNIFFYDGVCVYCKGIVHACIDGDKDNQFLYSPLQSEFAQKALGRFGVTSTDLLSMYVISNYNTSDEILMNAAPASNFVLKRMHGELKEIGEINSKKPRDVQDAEYKEVADTRYEKFGKMESIYIPEPEIRSKFIF